jgi:ribosomal protein S18 acetylase RimI-like enzyme
MQMRKPAFSIRKADITDAQAIVECLEEAFGPFREFYTPAAFGDTVSTPEDMANRMATMSVFVAAIPAGNIVGTIAYKVVGLGEGHIRGMAVRPAWHGEEVASELVQTVESELRNLGCSRISLDTTRLLQRAIRFYEKCGFRSSGRITDFFGMELLEYVKALDS